MRICPQKLQLAMAKAEMTSQEVTTSADIPYGTWSRVRSGKGLTPKTVGKVARALGVPVETLLADEQ